MLKILDGSGESGKSLNEQDIKDFLTTKVLNVHLGTVDESGHANIHPQSRQSSDILVTFRANARTVDSYEKHRIRLNRTYHLWKEYRPLFR
jgi:hypothetical protein